MQKAKQYNIADSNIANLGSDLEKKVKLEAAGHEDAWKGAGKEVGVQIWRIEKFKVVAIPKNTYGQFFSGDSYIVLHTYKKNDAFAWNVFFWLGTYTTQDEAGTAAYKTVELDDALGGAPVQYREVQGFESKVFLSLFKNGIRIQEGGMETGFKHVEGAKYRTRLLQIKGKKHIRVTEVPLTVKSLNAGDVFIIDAGKEIIQWNGSKSAALEKAKGATLAQAIEGEREGYSYNTVIDQGSEDDSFWKHLGGKGEIASAEAGGSDIEAEKTKPERKLFRLSDATGAMVFTEAAKGDNISKKLLDTNDVFILDTGAEVYAWVGHKASVGEKKNALQFAQQYVTKSGKPPQTTVARVLEGGENEIFNSYLSA